MNPRTPGPWQLVDKTICNAEGDSIIEILSGYSGDLKLIVAAPDMHQALTNILNDNKLMNAMGRALQHDIMDALRKAEGKS